MLEPRTVPTLPSLHPGPERECPEIYSEGRSQKAFLVGLMNLLSLPSVTQSRAMSADDLNAAALSAVTSHNTR